MRTRHATLALILVGTVIRPEVAQAQKKPAAIAAAENSNDSSPPKLPVPEEGAQRESESVIKNVYKTDFDRAKTTPQKGELAKKLLQEGIQTESDFTGKFVLMRIARDLAAQAGDVSTAMQSTDSIAQCFAIDPIVMKGEVLTKMSKSVTATPAQRELVASIDDVTDTAVDAENYTVAQQLTGLAITVSRNAKDAALLQRALARSKKIEQIAAAFAEAQKALKELDENPTGPDANLLVGKFRCFHRNDWESGLPFLTLGSDASLKSLAEKDATSPSTASDQAALGDAWWAVAEKETGVAKENIQSRAEHWYKPSLPSLSGLPKAKVEKRLEETVASTRRNTTKTKQSSTVKQDWSKYSFKGATVKGGVVRIAKLSDEQKRSGDWRKSGDFNEIRTKDVYVGGLDVAVVARTEKNNIRITGPRNSLVIFNWETDIPQVHITRPVESHATEFSVATVTAKPLSPNKWYALQFRVANDGIEVRVDGNLIFLEKKQYDLSAESSVAVWSWDSDLDVQSFAVTPLKATKGN